MTSIITAKTFATEANAQIDVMVKMVNTQIAAASRMIDQSMKSIDVAEAELVTAHADVKACLSELRVNTNQTIKTFSGLRRRKLTDVTPTKDDLNALNSADKALAGKFKQVASTIAAAKEVRATLGDKAITTPRALDLIVDLNSTITSILRELKSMETAVNRFKAKVNRAVAANKKLNVQAERIVAANKTKKVPATVAAKVTTEEVGEKSEVKKPVRKLATKKPVRKLATKKQTKETTKAPATKKKSTAKKSANK
jgi:hypothetical protein